MDESFTAAAQTLVFQCPRCAHQNSDDFEVLDVATPSPWCCAGCTRTFSVMLRECEHCGAESIDVALHSSELAPGEDQPCSICGRRSTRDEEL